MRLVFLLGHSNPFPGAAWVRIGSLSAFWSSMGHDVEIIGTFSLTTLSRIGVHRHGRVTLRNVIPYLGIFNTPLFLINLFVSFIALGVSIAVKKADYVIVSVPPGDFGVGAIMASRILRRKVIVDYRDQWEDFIRSKASSRLSRAIFSTISRLAALLYAQCSKVVVCTRGPIGQLRSDGIRNIAIMPNGADLEVFVPTSRKGRRPFTIMYSGALTSYYRLDVVVRALEILRRKGIRDTRLRLLVPGNPKPILDLAAKLGVSDAVESLGARDSPKEVAEELVRGDVGVVPFDNNPLWTNAQPAKFYEYCACGLPVIASVPKRSILAETIRRNRIGLVVAPQNPSAFASAIECLLKDREFRRRAGRNARQFVERRFDRRRIAKKYLSLLV